MPVAPTLLRRLAVLKLWRDPFDPDALFARINDSEYDWQELQRLMRANDRLEASEILRTLEAQFGSLRNPSELERLLIGDARSGRNDRLAEGLRAEIRALAGTGV